MFDLPKFWLGTAVYVLIIGVVIAGVGVSFNVLIGMPAKDPYKQVVRQTESSKATPVEIKREPAAPSALPLSPLVRRTPATDIAVAMPQIFEPKPLIVPEPKSTGRRGPSN